MLDVSIIIVNYNTRELTLQCLQSVYEHTKGVSFEVIVVDNGSSDSSVEAIRLQYPQVKLIANSENVGFGRANNAGINIAYGKYLFLLNSDCILLNNAIRVFFDYAEQNTDKIGALGTILLTKERKPGSSFGQFVSCKTVLKTHIQEYIHKVKPGINSISQFPLPLEVDYVIGADLFMPRSVLADTGLFDERFFMYSEENELQYRMSFRGYKRVIIEGPEIIHLEGGSTGVKLNRQLMRYTSLFLYIKKYNNPVKYLFFRIAIFFLLFPKICYQPYIFKEKKAFIKFLLS